jgi:methyl-accepting chemotaxis protein
MARKRLFKRRMFLGELQYRMLGGQFLYLASLILLFSSVLYLPWLLASYGGPPGQPDYGLAAQQLAAMHERLWLALPVIVLLCVLHSILVSHRIAGPLYRFKRIFTDLGNGDLSMRVKVRRTDYLVQEADAMNMMIGSLAGKMRGVRESHQTACATLSELMGAMGADAGREAHMLAGKLGTELDQLGEALRQFRIPAAKGVPSPSAPAVPGMPPKRPELARLTF